MASCSHNPQHTYDRGPNSHRSQPNGGRGNGKRGRGGKSINNNYYQYNGRHSHSAYQGSRSMSGASGMFTYPAGPSPPLGVPTGEASPSMGTMYNTPNPWLLPGATTVCPGTAANGQPSTVSGHFIPHHTPSYSVSPPHMTPMTNCPRQTIPSNYAPSTAPIMNTKPTAVGSVDIVSSMSEQAPIYASLHAPTSHHDATTIIQHGRATRTAPSSPVRPNRSARETFVNTAAMPTEKTHLLSKDRAFNKTSEELVQVLDHAVLARLQTLDVANAAELQKTLCKALEDRRVSQSEMYDKRSVLLTQLGHAREYATYHNCNTLKSYDAFVEKMTDLSFSLGGRRDTVQRKAIECLKAAAVHSKRATKYREQVDLYRDALEATDSMSLDLTTELVNTIYEVVMKALQKATKSDMLTSTEVTATPEGVMMINTATTTDVSIIPRLPDTTEFTSMTEVENETNKNMQEPETEPANAEKPASEVSTINSLHLADINKDNHTTDDTTLEEASRNDIQPAVSGQSSQNMHRTTHKLNNSNTLLGNEWSNWKDHIKSDDEKTKRQAHEGFNHRHGQTFRPELKETYKNRQGESQQTVHKKIGGSVATVTANDFEGGLKDHIDHTKSVENPIVAEPDFIIRKDAEKQAKPEQLEHGFITLQEKKIDGIELQKSVEDINTIRADHVDAEELRHDVNATADASARPVSSHGLTEQISVTALQTTIQSYIYEKTPKAKQETQANYSDSMSPTQGARKNQTCIEASAEQNVPKSQTGNQTAKDIAPEDQKVAVRRQKHKQSKAKVKARKKALAAANNSEDSVSLVKTDDIPSELAGDN